MYRILLPIVVLIAASSAEAACNLDAGTRACETALASSPSSWIEMLDDLAAQEPIGEALALKHFYTGAAYYRLSVSESAPTLRCEYASRSLLQLGAFLDAIVESSDAIGKDLYETLLRAKIYLGEIERDATCPQRGFPVARLGQLARREVDGVFAKVLADPEMRAATGMDRLYQYAGDLVGKASDMLSKLESAKTELEALRTETRRSGDGRLGLIAAKVEPWHVGIYDAGSSLRRDIDTKRTLVTAKQTEVRAIDVDGLISRRAGLEQGVNAYASRLGAWLTRSDAFVTGAVTGNPALRAAIETSNAAAAALVVARGHADATLTSVSGALKRKNLVKCVGEALQFWFCKNGR